MESKYVRFVLSRAFYDALDDDERQRLRESFDMNLMIQPLLPGHVWESPVVKGENGKTSGGDQYYVVGGHTFLPECVTQLAAFVANFPQVIGRLRKGAPTLPDMPKRKQAVEELIEALNKPNKLGIDFGGSRDHFDWKLDVLDPSGVDPEVMQMLSRKEMSEWTQLPPPNERIAGNAR